MPRDEYRSLYRAAALEYLDAHGWEPDFFLECIGTPEGFEPTFGETIKRYRSESGMRAVDLAAELDIHRAYLSRLENNRQRPSVRLTERFADRFGLDPVALYSLALTDSMAAKHRDR